MCDSGKVKNPVTKRCINIGSAVFKKLLADPNIVFPPEDLAKIRALGYAPASGRAPPPPKPKSDEIVEVLKIPAKTNNRILGYLKRSIKPGASPYISAAHKQYCNKMDDASILEEPRVITNIVYDIPYSTCPLQHNTYLNYLDTKKIPYITRFNKSIEINYNNYNKDVAMQLFKDHDIDIDFDWFKKMDAYIRGLSNYDAFTILGYSYHSFDFINKYLVGEMTDSRLKALMYEDMYKNYYFPFYVQMHSILDTLFIDPSNDDSYTHNSSKKKASAWVKWCRRKTAGECYKVILKIMRSFPYDFMKKVMELFKADLSRIINASPPIDKQLVLYRGVKDDYFMRDAKNRYYTNKTFVSCSLDPNHAYKYLRGNNCCFKRIVMLPGTHALFISGISCYPNEMEMVVDADSIMYISELKSYKMYNEYYVKKDMCFTKGYINDVKIAEMVFTP